MIVAATGHRPAKLGGYGADAAQRRRDLAYHWLAGQRPERVISGMALGWDQDFATAAHNLGIPFVAAVPFIGQERAWPAESQRAFNALLAVAAEVVIVSPGGYSPAAMHARNHWMVDHCGLLCALWDGSDGGTAGCVRYAQRQHRAIVNLWAGWTARNTY